MTNKEIQGDYVWLLYRYRVNCYMAMFIFRGYGFVRFSDETEQKRALMEMQGAVGLGGRAIKVSQATPKK